MEENFRSCIVCFVTLLVLSFLIQEQKKGNELNFKNGIKTLKKHVYADHVLLAIFFKK
jgi:hypothetical protein